MYCIPRNKPNDASLIYDMKHIQYILQTNGDEKTIITIESTSAKIILNNV